MFFGLISMCFVYVEWIYLSVVLKHEKKFAHDERMLFKVLVAVVSFIVWRNESKLYWATG
jgi:hypothetical protein